MASLGCLERVELGVRAANVVRLVVDRTDRPTHAKVHLLAQATLDWLEQKGADDSILRWDDSGDDEDGD